MSFLRELEPRRIAFSLARDRDNAIMVTVPVPGELWEVEFLDHGSVEVERFKSDGEIHGEGVLNELFSRYSK